MGLAFEAIVPKQFHSAALAKKALDRFLLNFKGEAQRELQQYPAWQPWKNPPKKGPRAGGKRTGNLGRNWNTYQLVSGQSLTMTNPVSYAPYVQGTGPKQPYVRGKSQAKALRARGWPAIDEVAGRALKAAIAKTDLAEGQ